MKCAVEFGLGAMIYIPSFIKIGSGIQKLIWGDAQTAWRSHKPTSVGSFVSLLSTTYRHMG
jgi:hypothetical protein